MYLLSPILVKVRVIASPEFVRWMKALEPRNRGRVIQLLDALTERGADLGEPLAKPIQSSRHTPLMWELRWNDRSIGQHLRVLFAFHETTAVALHGGDKTGNWDDWYLVAIPTADARFDHYLRQQEKDHG